MEQILRLVYRLTKYMKFEVVYYETQQTCIQSSYKNIIETQQNNSLNPILEFGIYPQSMPTEWTHARTLRPWQSVRLDL